MKGKGDKISRSNNRTRQDQDKEKNIKKVLD